MICHGLIFSLALGLFTACTQATNGVTPVPPSSSVKNPMLVRVGTSSLVIVGEQAIKGFDPITNMAIVAYGPHPSSQKPPVFNIPFNPLPGYPPNAWHPQGVTSDALGRLYVAGGTPVASFPAIYTGMIAIYDSPLDNPTFPNRLIFGPHTGLFGSRHGYFVAVDSLGRIYVANSGQAEVLVYPPNAHGDVPPIAEIRGPNTGLAYCPAGTSDCSGNALALRLDRSGNIYVGGLDQVSVFAAGKFGDVAPIRVIRGSATHLAWANGLAVAYDGTVYVTNFELSTTGLPGVITIYAAGANGNVAPIRTISGPNTRLIDPLGIAVCPDGTLYVANNVQFHPTTQSRNLLIFSANSNGNIAPHQVLGAAAGIVHPIPIGF